MKSIADVLSTHRENLMLAADELTRRFKHEASAFRDAAMQWCAVASEQAATSLGEHNPSVPAPAAAFDLMVEGTSDAPFLNGLVRRARRKEYLRGIRQEAETYDLDLLQALLSVWPHRDRPHELAVPLGRWAKAYAECGCTAAKVLGVGTRLADLPELAYAIVEAVDASPFDPCTKPRHLCTAAAPAGELRAALALHRIAEGHEEHQLDRDALERVDPRCYLRDRAAGVFVYAVLRRGHCDLPGLWVAVDRALGDHQSKEWCRAVALLAAAARDAEQERAVQVLADATRRSLAPDGPLREIVATTFGGTFSGRGWGRGRLARKLLPLSLAFIGRGKWPTTEWLRCFRPALLGGEHDRSLSEVQELERAHERMRDVLAEALLHVASDQERGIEQRHRALDGLERLSPAGDSSIVRALSKVKEPATIGQRAREVQRAIRESRRTGVVDAELAVRDAWECFAASSEPNAAR